MSVSSSCGNPTGIPDDLESFFHVLLWHAVRFLPHNCKNVGAFMSSFFDGAEYCDGDFASGSHKTWAMENGRIYTKNNTTRNAKIPLLAFYIDKESQETHPLQRVIDQILITFKEYYATLNLENDTVKKDPSFEAVLSRPSGSNEPAAIDTSTTSAVKTHQTMRIIYDFFFERERVSWPENEVTEDQLPENYDHARAQNYPSTRSSFLPNAKHSAQMNSADGSEVSGPLKSKGKLSSTSRPRKRPIVVDPDQVPPPAPRSTSGPSAGTRSRSRATTSGTSAKRRKTDTTANALPSPSESSSNAVAGPSQASASSRTIGRQKSLRKTRGGHRN